MATIQMTVYPVTINGGDGAFRSYTTSLGLGSDSALERQEFDATKLNDVIAKAEDARNTYETKGVEAMVSLRIKKGSRAPSGYRKWEQMRGPILADPNGKWGKQATA